MDPFTMALIISAGVNIIGGIMSSSANKKAAAAQKAMMDRIFGEIDALEVPSIEKQKLQLNYLRKIGVLNPKLEERITLEPSAFESVGVPKELIETQNRMLKGLEDIYNQEGMTAEDKFRQAEIFSKEATEERGRRDAILQNMRQRGIGGSGLELGAQMIAQQGSAQRRSMQGLELEALAERRALEALKNAGSLAGQMRGQESNEQLSKARGLDAMATFNAQSAQSLEGRNVDRANTAQAANLGEAQRIADSNVGLQNYQQEYNKKLRQQLYQNEMNKLALKSGAGQASAQVDVDLAKQQANTYSDVASGIGRGAMAYGKYSQGNTSPSSQTTPEIDEEDDLYWVP
jgi:hypothetical protein